MFADGGNAVQVLLYERAARGLKLERSGVAAVPGRTSLTWSRAEVSACLARVSSSSSLIENWSALGWPSFDGGMIAGCCLYKEHDGGPPFFLALLGYRLRRLLTPRWLGATQGNGAQAATDATPRRTPPRHPTARTMHAAQLSIPGHRRAVIPTLRSFRGASVQRGGVRGKARPARLVRMGGAVYRVAAGRSLLRQPGTPRLGPVLRSAAKVPQSRKPALHSPSMWTSGERYACLQACRDREVDWMLLLVADRGARALMPTCNCGCVGGHIPAARTHHRPHGCAAFASAGSFDCRSRSARTRSGAPDAGAAGGHALAGALGLPTPGVCAAHGGARARAWRGASSALPRLLQVRYRLAAARARL